MAALLSRLQYNILTKNSLRLSKFVAVLSTQGSSTLKNVCRPQQNSKSGDKTLRYFLTYSVLVSSFGYILYKWKNDFRERFCNLNVIVPTVQAKTNFTTEVGHNRDKYNFIADVVDISAPSVVYIEIKDSSRIDFFTGKPATASNGSGFIVGSDGLILTNAHVVINKPNTAVKVRLHDGSVYTGIVEDVDMQSDLATVRINKTNLPVMKLGDSAKIRPGEFVVAIGSPLALSNSITSGVVSSANRPSTELGLHHKRMAYIQTDAAITFGNSGGPLVNLDGEAIGINAMKVTSGISFAIPIDYAKDFLKKSELRRKNKGVQKAVQEPKRRYIGITMLTLTPDILFELQQKKGSIPPAIKHGVLVWKVMIGSPAYNGGLQAGDIVTHANSEPVVAAVNIYKALEKTGPLNLTVIRNGEVLNVQIDPEDV